MLASHQTFGWIRAPGISNSRFKSSSEGQNLFCFNVLSALYHFLSCNRYSKTRILTTGAKLMTGLQSTAFIGFPHWGQKCNGVRMVKCLGVVSAKILESVLGMDTAVLALLFNLHRDISLLQVLLGFWSDPFLFLSCVPFVIETLL